MEFVVIKVIILFTLHVVVSLVVAGALKEKGRVPDNDTSTYFLWPLDLLEWAGGAAARALEEIGRDIVREDPPEPEPVLEDIWEMLEHDGQWEKWRDCAHELEMVLSEEDEEEE